MNDEAKNVQKKSGLKLSWFRAWLLLSAAAFVIILVVTLLLQWPRNSREWGGDLAAASILGLVVATGFLGLWAFVRWLGCWKNFRRFLFGCACFATLIALFYAEEDWRGWHAWNRFKHQEEAKGERFDLKDLAPPPVPDDQNFAMAPIWVELIEANYSTNTAQKWYGTNLVEEAPVKDRGRLRLGVGAWEDYRHWPTNGDWAKSTLTDLKPWQNYYRTLAARTNLFPVAPELQTPAQAVLLALSKYDSTIELLRRASQRPYARFPLGYDREDVWAILLPHLAVLKHCAQVLELRAIAELQNNESNQALPDVKLMFRLMDSIRNEPFLISHLVHIAIFQITLQPIYQGLARHQWSDAQLAELDAELAKLDFLAGYQRAMRGERACQASAVEFLRRRGLRRFNEQFNLTGNDDHTQLSVAALLHYLCPSGWFYQNDLRICQFYTKWYLPLADEKTGTVSPAAVRAAGTAFGMEVRNRTPENFLAGLLLPRLTQVVEKFAYAQSATDLARVAIALERYRLAHGEYPESLDALTPLFIEKIPRDVIGGQPLHYRRTDDGQFVLYSIGWNGQDDGGVVSLRNNGRVDTDKGDWVWRYPTKVE